MEKIGRQVFLYDFYGELLTDHQKSVYEDVVLNDLSLSEIADERGISRQGVHDLVKRCDRILASYEEKLHLVERFFKNRKNVVRIRELSAGGDGDSSEVLAEIYRISGQILEEL
ncbi:MAG: YlxM family DNA-binding protein [Clostridiales bacterium]|nr:YlxM family DNA-binding protein [Clostridiales bacterium]MCD8109298.1 YlxM family DNA-binding protein [Clostridiales bacterium]MCD8133482.1 YlxM family DNA-binding protein [Clostridiales bacterium]